MKRSNKNIFLSLFITICIVVFNFNITFAKDSIFSNKINVYEVTETITLRSNNYSNYELTYNIGENSESPYQREISLQAYGPNCKIVTENKTKKLKAKGNINKGKIIQYKIVRKLYNNNIIYNADLSQTSGDYSNFKEYNKYTSPDIKIESDTRLISEISKYLFNGLTNPYRKAERAYGLVNTYMTYDNNYGNRGAYSALKNRRGVCEDYAELYVALLRASGVPARVVGGYWIDNNQYENINFSQHAWAEFYLPEYGWIPVEPTNILYNNGKKIIDWNYFAKLKNNDHLIQGYNVNNGIDGMARITYSGSRVNMFHDVSIKKIK